MSTYSELDLFWEEAARTVATGDFSAYSALYHPDAVVVDTVTAPNGTKPIAEALRQWKASFDETASSTRETTLAFRFSRRLHNSETAHESGIFQYTSSSNTEPVKTIYVKFEALMVKKDTKWMWLMEYQRELTSKDEWDSLPGFRN
jgi:ketosteroid isomerase-like protein